MPVLKLSRIERRRLTVFFSSLLFAIFAWLFFTFSQRYEYSMHVKISYVDPPFHKAFRPLNDDTLTMKLEGTGWQLLFSRFRTDTASVKVSLKALNNGSFVTLTDQSRFISRQFNSGQKFISASPDTLFFDFSKRITKKVPVKLLYKLSFVDGFGMSGPLTFVPDSVIVSGAAEDLEKVTSWETEIFSRSQIEEDVNVKVAMKAADGSIDVIPQQVKVKVPVDIFTEKVVEIPVKLLNNQNEDVQLLPEKVKVTVLSSLKGYPKLEKDSFMITADLDGWARFKYPQLPVVFKKFPHFSKLVKVEPQVVDFIIKK